MTAKQSAGSQSGEIVTADAEPTSAFNQEAFMAARQAEYDAAIDAICATLGISLSPGANRSAALEAATQQYYLQATAQEESPRKVVIGVAGPGAVGKGTLVAFLRDQGGFGVNINVTTRPARSNNGIPERDGVEYYFRTPEQYAEEAAAGKYLTTSSKPGRGDYAVSRAGIEAALAGSSRGCLVEESPQALTALVNALKVNDPELRGVILYILPPGATAGREVYELVERLRTRSGANFNEADLVSTCGPRQMQELASMAEAIRSGATVLFLENAELQASYAKLARLFLS